MYRCGNICNIAVELTCNQHEDEEDLIMFGKYCLKNYLSKNSNKCPIGAHNNPTHSNNKFTIKRINKLHVICPNSNKLKLKNNDNNNEPELKEKEGEVIVTNLGHDMSLGKILIWIFFVSVMCT